MLHQSNLFDAPFVGSSAFNIAAESIICGRRLRKRLQSGGLAKIYPSIIVHFTEHERIKHYALQLSLQLLRLVRRE